MLLSLANANDSKLKKWVADMVDVIENALKAAGAEKERGRTLAGGLSKLVEKWAEFRRMVMDSGPYDFLKEQLASILKWVEKLEENDGLKELAKEWGENLTEALKSLKRSMIGVWLWLKKMGPQSFDLAKSLDVLKIASGALALVVGGSLIKALGLALKSVLLLSRALLFTPVGLLLTAVMGIAALMHKAGVLIPFIDGLKKGFEGFGEAIGPSLTGLLDALGKSFGHTTDSFRDANGELDPQKFHDLGEAIGTLTTGVLKDLIDMLAKAVKYMGELRDLSRSAGTWLADITGPDLQGERLTVEKIRSARLRGDDEELRRLLKKSGNLPGNAKTNTGTNVAGNPETVVRPLETPLNSIRVKINEPQNINLVVNIKGQVDGAAITSTAASDTPGIKVTNATRQNMGFRP